MTCIAGLEHGGKVWLGADSAWSDPEEITYMTEPKLWTVTGNGETILMGNSGSGRVGQVAKFNLKLPKRAEGCRDDLQYLTISVVGALRRVLKAAGAIFMKGPPDEGGGGSDYIDGTVTMDAVFLLAYRRRLYAVYTDFSVVRARDGLDAIGSGGREARGALAVTKGKPRARLLAALRVAERFTTRVRRPFVVRSIG